MDSTVHNITITTPLNTDRVLSLYSVNPIANSAVTTALQAKADLVNGKVPEAQLPSSALGITEVLIQGSTASLVTGSTATVPVATTAVAGVVRIGNGMRVISSQIFLSQCTNSLMDSRNVWQAVIGSNLDYAVRSVNTAATYLPAALSSVSFVLPASADNIHSALYIHEPSVAPVYTLPEAESLMRRNVGNIYVRSTSDDSGSAKAWAHVEQAHAKVYTASAAPAAGAQLYTDSAMTVSGGTVTTVNPVMHEIILQVHFSTVTSCSFQDAAGTAIVLQAEIEIESGDWWTFLCRYNGARHAWAVYPVKEN